MQGGKVTDSMAALHIGRQMCPLDCPSRLVEARSLESSGSCWSCRSERLELPRDTHNFASG